MASHATKPMESVETVIEQVKEATIEVRENVSDAIDTLGTLIKRHPLSSLFIGVGIGCAAGLVISSWAKK